MDTWYNNDDHANNGKTNYDNDGNIEMHIIMIIMINE